MESIPLVKPIENKASSFGALYQTAQASYADSHPVKQFSKWALKQIEGGIGIQGGGTGRADNQYGKQKTAGPFLRT